jgi:hypothetical protein
MRGDALQLLSELRKSGITVTVLPDGSSLHVLPKLDDASLREPGARV